MIAGLRGTVAGKESDAVLIDVNGVIYRVGTSSTTLSELRGEAETVYLHTRLVVREDQLALYGFLSPEEVILFDLVTGVTGIGPRIGCAILSRFTPEALHAAARRLRVPCLLVRGRHSDLLTEDGAAEFRRAVPHAEFVDINGAGHMVAGDTNDPFTEAVAAFLAPLAQRQRESA